MHNYKIFLNEKKQALSKIDKSRKKSIDKKIKPIIDLINKSNFFYTTSSCSGRALLMKEIGKKAPNLIIASWHNKISSKELMNEIKKIKNEKNIIYFKFESPIIHVKSYDINKLGELCQLARDCGFKESNFYFVSQKKFPIAEIKSNESISLPIFYKKLLVNKDYIKILISQVNKKFYQIDKKLKKLKEKIKIYFYNK